MSRVYTVPPKLSPAALTTTASRGSVPPPQGYTQNSSFLPSPQTNTTESSASPASSSLSPLRNDRDEDVGDICAAAMNLVTFLDTETLRELEVKMGTSSHSKAEVVELIAASITNCRAVTNPWFFTHNDEGEPLRKSDADFRAALRNSTSFSISQLEALVESVDKHGTNRIKYSDIISFFIAAGRKVSPAAGGKKARKGQTPEGVVANDAVRNDENSPQIASTALQYDAIELLTAHHYVALTAVAQRNAFLAATLRWIDIVDENFQVMPATRKIVPPSDPTLTIACVDYAASLDEIIVGFHNCKIMTFDFVDGRKQREVVISGVPCSLRFVPSNSNVDNAESSDKGGSLLCGTDTGSVVEITLLSSASIRIVSTNKVSLTMKISSILPLFDLGIVACIAGKQIVICDMLTGKMLKQPYVAASMITTAAIHHATSSLVFTTTGVLSSIHFFTRRMLKLSRLENPEEITKKYAPASSAVDSFCVLAQDSYSDENMVTVTTGGVVTIWNISKRHVVSAVPQDGPEIQLRLPPAAIGLNFAASLPLASTRPGILIGNKSCIVKITRLPQQVTLVRDVENAKALSKFQTSFEVAVASFALSPKHTAFSHPQQCIVNVFPQGIQVFDVVTRESKVELSFGASPVASRAKAKQPLRIRSACLGPGLMLLLGSENGDIHAFSLEASTIGDCDLISTRVCPGEVASIFFCPSLNVIGFASFDGSVTTAVLDENCEKMSNFVTATAIHRCDALDYNSEVNLLTVADLEEEIVRLFVVVDTGTRLQQVARFSLFGTCCVLPKSQLSSHSLVAPVSHQSGGSALNLLAGKEGKLYTAKVLLLPRRRNYLEKQLFSHEVELANVLVSVAAQGPSESSSYVVLSLMSEEDEELDESFLTRVHRTAKSAFPNKFSVLMEVTVDKKTVTAVCPGTNDDFALGFSDGTVSLLSPSTKEIKSAAVSRSVSLQQEAIAVLCSMPAQNNIAVCRTTEKPQFLFRRRNGRDEIAVEPPVPGFPNPLSPSKFGISEDSPMSSRKARSAKPERPSPSILPRIRAGSAGTAQRGGGGNSILEAIARTTPGKRDLSRPFALPSLFSASRR